MAYRSIMVHMNLGGGNLSALRVARDLADQFGARLIGISSGYPIAPVHSAGMIATSILEADDPAFKSALEGCESRFLEAAQGLNRPIEWRTDIEMPTVFLSTEARAADLIVVGRHVGSAAPTQTLDIGDAVMKVGRPILIVPSLKNNLALNRALVAWKDTRESRHAISAALPILKKCGSVMIVQIISDESEHPAASAGLEDVRTWLRQHGVIASAAQVETAAGDIGPHLDLIAEQEQADLIIAGAYGHGRLREWIFGGATQYLLRHSSACVLLAH